MTGAWEWLEVAAAKMMLGALGWLPEPMALRVGTLMGDVAWLVDRRHRRVALHNLARSFPDQTNSQRKRTARAVFRNLGLSLAEWAHAHKAPAGVLHGRVTFEGLEHAERAVEAGRGAVMLVGHLGNWELTGAMFAAHFPDRVTVAAQIQNNRRFDSFMNGLRRRGGMKVVSVRPGVSRELLSELQKNRFLGILADQHAGSKGLVLNFLDRPCSVLRSPAVLARRAGSPILCAALTRRSQGRYLFRISSPVDMKGSLSAVTERWLRVYESWVREDPSQWFWVHRRWKIVREDK